MSREIDIEIGCFEGMDKHHCQSFVLTETIFYIKVLLGIAIGVIAFYALFHSIGYFMSLFYAPVPEANLFLVGVLWILAVFMVGVISSLPIMIVQNVDYEPYMKQPNQGLIHYAWTRSLFFTILGISLYTAFTIHYSLTLYIVKFFLGDPVILWHPPINKYTEYADFTVYALFTYMFLMAILFISLIVWLVYNCCRFRWEEYAINKKLLKKRASKRE